MLDPIAGWLVILLSNGGYCLGDGPCTVDVQWAADVEMPAAVVAWDVSYAHTVIADGRVLLAGRGAPTRITLTLPPVRARIALAWSYRLLRQCDAEVLATGSRTIEVYPTTEFARLAARLAGGRVLVLETAATTALSRLLEDAGVAAHRVAALAEVELQPADVVLVGPERLRATRESDGPLLAAAENGAGVLMLVQRGVGQVTGFEVRPCHVTVGAIWQTAHPALSDVPPDAWRSWLEGGEPVVSAVEVRADDTTATELAYWPASCWERTPATGMALIVEKKVGRGRLMLCQVPACANVDDPRTQRFLAAALEYLATKARAVPVPVPESARRVTQPIEVRNKVTWSSSGVDHE